MNFLLAALSKIPTLHLFLIGVVTIVSGDVFAKYWSLSRSSLDSSLSIFFYILGGFVFIAIVSRTHEVGISNVIWNVAGIIGTLLVGYFLFQEPISLKQFIGIILGFAAIFLITG